ncbi:MAG: hypothetical protein AAF653_00485 [Chloroflexota bacterium]
MTDNRVLLYMMWAVFGLMLLTATTRSVAQVTITSTPAQIRMASITPEPLMTESTIESGFEISGDTATPRGITMLEPVSEVNVRTSPEIAEDNQIGVIRAGERYMVVGQYFNWVQFQYDLAPNQRAWVYRDLVTIIGDEAGIPTLVPDATETPEQVSLGVTQTQQAILAQPGGVLTITAQARVIELPDGALEQNGEAGSQAVTSNITPQPTFTYPPGVQVGLPELEVTREIVLDTAIGNTESPIAPIVPILVLGGAGMLGLLLSVLRG